MTTPVAELREAADALAVALAKAGLTNPLSVPWKTLGPAFQKLLGGKFDPLDAQHRMLAMGLTALVGERVAKEPGGFWFPHRDAVGGASIGFADAVFTVSPSALASVAIQTGELEDGLEDVRRALAAARAKSQLQRKLTPKDYQALLDPSFLEFVTLDKKRAAQTWGQPPPAIAALLQDALFRAPGLSREGRQWTEDLAFALRSLDARAPLIAQARAAPRAFERCVHLFSAVYGTGPIAERGWMEAAFRLLAAGSTPTLREPSGDAKTALQKAGGPFQLYLRSLTPMAGVPREGILGLFALEDLKLLDSHLQGVPELRLTALNPRKLLPLFEKHDAAKTRVSVSTFLADLSAKVGSTQVLEGHELGLFEEALAFIKRLYDTVAYALRDETPFCIRRLSELDARSEAHLGPLRQVVE